MAPVDVELQLVELAAPASGNSARRTLGRAEQIASGQSGPADR
jgi:hypothetical protein